MATLAPIPPSPMERERRFYFVVSLVFLSAAIAGFGSFFAFGVSSFASPWWVHVHAVAASGFLALYVVQNWLVDRGNFALHRGLGVFGAILALFLAAYSSWALTMTVAHGRMAHFFTAPFFLAMDWINIVVFLGLAGAGLALRARSDWHKRLMFGAMLSMMSVAWGRLILPRFFDQRALVIVWAVLVAHLVAAMAFDRRVHGKVHPAHYWTLAGLTAWITGLFAVSANPAFAAFANGFLP